MKRVLILGATGNGLFNANMINQTFDAGLCNFRCTGFVNDSPEGFKGYPVAGGFDKIDEFLEDDYYFLVGFGVDSRPGRRNFFADLNIPPERYATFVHPTAVISGDVVIEPGVIINPNVTINTGTTVGEGVRIMPGATIGSDCVLRQYSFVSVNSCIDDKCTLEEGCYLGLGSFLGEGVTVGDSSLLGMGGFLEKSIGSNEIWVGNPARFLKKRF